MNTSIRILFALSLAIAVSHMFIACTESKTVYTESTPETVETAGGDNQNPVTNPSNPENPNSAGKKADKDPPYVTATIPKLGSKGTAVTTSVSIQLSEPIDINSVANDTFTVVDSSGTAVDGMVSLDTLRLNIIFIPKSALTSAEIYTATLRPSVTDLAGNTLTDSYIWSFLIGTPSTTPQDLTPPFVTKTSPALGDSIVALDSKVTVTFSETLSVNSVDNSSLTIKDSHKNIIGGNIALSDDKKEIIFTPDAPLLDSETYSVAVNTQISDAAGNNMSNNYIYTFSTNSTKVIKIIAGSSTFFAIKENGTLWGWGRNGYSQIGDGTQIDRNQPVRAIITDVLDVAPGLASTTVLKKDGTVWTWGDNTYGQLGDDSTGVRTIPQQVLDDVSQIAATNHNVFVLKTDGTLWGWGRDYLVLGYNGSGYGAHPEPIQIQGINGTITHLFAGAANPIVVARSDPEDPSTAAVWMWGSNSAGHLGSGECTDTIVPSQVLLNNKPLENVKTVVPGAAAFAAITNDNKLYMWGYTYYGQVAKPPAGAPKCGSYGNPTPYVAMENVKSAFMGVRSGQTYVITDDDNLWVWGLNQYGQLGFAQTTSSQNQATPLNLGLITGIDSIAGSSNGTAILKTDGSILTAGDNTSGSLGNASASFAAYRPYHPFAMPPIKSVSSYPSSAKRNSSLVLTEDGTVWAWGSNSRCQLGLADKIGTTLMFNSPIQVAPEKLKNITAVSLGYDHALALSADGTVWAWGDNTLGQLGIGTSSTQPICDPIQVKAPDGATNLTQISLISAGTTSSIFIAQDPATKETTGYGTGMKWKLGIGFNGNGFVTLPVKIDALPTDIKLISAGTSRYMVVTESGKVYGWGYSNYRNTNWQDSSKYFYSPVSVKNPDNTEITKATDVCSGQSATLILLNDGTVLAWGLNSLDNPLGVESKETDYIMRPVLKINNAVQLGCDYGLSYLARTNDGKVWSWGSNVSIVGSLGVGNTVSYWEPQLIPNSTGSGNLDHIKSVAYSSFIKDDGSLWLLGFSPDGEIDSSSSFVNVTWP